jgi:predicted esterase
MTTGALAAIVACEPAAIPAPRDPTPQVVPAVPAPELADTPREEPTVASQSGDEPEPLPPLEGDPFVDLTLSWGEPALISVPLGARSPQPVLVATHGAGGRAEYHCGLWREIVGERGFVVCPRGYPMNRLDPHTGYFYDGHPALGREIEAAMQALGERFGDHVDRAAPIFAGYSQGASMGALVLPHHPAAFARAVLWEGGVGQYQEWNVAVAERFRARGARRVLLACGRPKCHEPAQRTAGYFQRASIDARLVYVAGAGHTAGGALAEAVAASFSWLVEDDPRW